VNPALRPDDERAGRQKLFLSGDLDLRQHYLPAVTEKLVVVHGGESEG
jgi:hypothetical protein